MEPIYVVLVITLVIWAGIFSYMWHIDSQVRKLSKNVDKIKSNGNK